MYTLHIILNLFRSRQCKRKNDNCLFKKILNYRKKIASRFDKTLTLTQFLLILIKVQSTVHPEIDI